MSKTVLHLRGSTGYHAARIPVKWDDGQILFRITEMSDELQEEYDQAQQEKLGFVAKLGIPREQIEQLSQTQEGIDGLQNALFAAALTQVVAGDTSMFDMVRSVRKSAAELRDRIVASGLIEFPEEVQWDQEERPKVTLETVKLLPLIIRDQLQVAIVTESGLSGDERELFAGLAGR